MGEPKIAQPVAATRADLQRAYAQANGPLNYAQHREAMIEVNAILMRLREAEAARTSQSPPADDTGERSDA